MAKWENVKIFHRIFLHADEAFCGGKWAFCNRGEASADEKGSARCMFFAQRHAFVQLFCLHFAAFHIAVSTPQKKKSTPNFSAALTFESRRTPFSKKSVQAADILPFSKLSQNGLIFAKASFRAKYSKYGGQKWAFCQYLLKFRWTDARFQMECSL